MVEYDELRYAAVHKQWIGDRWDFQLVQRFSTLDQANEWIEDKEAGEYFLVEQVMQ